MVYVGTTQKYVFATHPGDIFWCTADCGWVTGHSYLTYGAGKDGWVVCGCVDAAVQLSTHSQQQYDSRGPAPALCCPNLPCPCLAGPLLCRAVSVVFEGVPTYPSPARCWEVVEKYQVGCLQD